MKTYTIPTAILNDLVKKLGKLKTKAASFNQTIDWTVSEPFQKKQDIYDVDFTVIPPVKHKLYSCYVEAVDITIECSILKHEGWHVVAKLEYLAEGINLVHKYDDFAEDLTRYINAPLDCIHCKTKRYRKQAYLVTKDNFILMVGKSCLKEYTGIDPSAILLKESLDNIVMLDKDVWLDYARRENIAKHSFETSKIVALACEIYSQHGYRKAEEHNSNKTKLTNLIYSNFEVSIESQKMAEQVLKYFRDINNTPFICNLKSISQKEYVSFNTFGFIAYMPIAYNKALEYEQKMKDNPENNSAWVGSIKERIDVNISSHSIITSYLSEYGWIYIYKIMDYKGNIFIWKTSKENVITGLGVLTGTVKEHSEYKNIKQTVLTRCKYQTLDEYKFNNPLGLALLTAI